MAEHFQEVADFLVIYISEAHPKDAWPLGKHVEIESHKNINDRIGAAKFYQQKFGLRIPMLVDTMENQFDKNYASWPERFYIIINNQIHYMGLPSSNDQGYSKNKLWNELDGIRKSSLQVDVIDNLKSNVVETEITTTCNSSKVVSEHQINEMNNTDNPITPTLINNLQDQLILTDKKE